jgi:undecaprenyl-phosphate galactose phosphotransferase
MFRKTICSVSLIAFDVGSLLLSFFLAYLIRKEILFYIHPAFRMWTFPFETYLINYPYFLGLWVVILAYERLYTKRFALGEEIKRLWKGASISFLIIMVLTFAARISMNVSRTVIILSWALSFFLLPTFRLAAKKILNRAGIWQRNILILGAGRTGEMVLERVKKNKNMGYEPVGFLDDDEAKLGKKIGGVKVLGKLSEIESWVQEKKVGDVVIAMPGVSRGELLEVVSLCEGVVDEIRVIPDMFGLATVGVKAEDLDGILLFDMEWNLAKSHNIFVKRVIDIILSSFAIAILSPLMAFISIKIRRGSKGPVIFSQKRLWKGKSTFDFLKFRTMYLNGDERLSKFLKENPQARKEWEEFAKIKSGDPRVTKFGGWLRRYSLDELPQLINVLRGKMSLVGPRPYLPREFEKMGGYRKTILKALPGMTGLWQVSGKSELSLEDRLRLEEYYVRNWSLWLDFVILVKTVKVVWRGEGI